MEIESRKLGELQAVEVAMHSDGDTSAALDNEKCGDIIQIEKEDAKSESSGIMSASDMESSLAELDDIKCVRVPNDPSYSHICKPDL